MRKLAVATILAGAALGAVACEKIRAFELPDPAPDTDLAFAVLFEDGAPAVIGDVTRRQTLYAGNYELTGGGGLAPTLFFVQGEDLLAAAETACAGLPEGAERLLCRERVAGCADDATCWRAATRVDGCGDGVALEDVPLIAFEDSGGAFEAVEVDFSASMTLCAPALHPGCPNRRAGYVLTEGGAFACVAETRQTGCAVELEAAGCGISDITATLGEDGVPTEIGAGGCTQIAAEASSSPFGAAADFAVRCGDRTLQVRPMQSLLATLGCVRRGPPLFQPDNFADGRVVDARVWTGAGGQPRLLMTGSGLDDCADEGCAVRSDTACVAHCNMRCIDNVSLSGCAQSSWDACTGLSEEDLCQQRCRQYCEAQLAGDCPRDTIGLSATLSAFEQPEVDRGRVNIGFDTRASALGQPAVAPLGGPWLAIGTRDHVEVVVGGPSDSLLSRGRFETSAALAGLVTWAENRIAWFGPGGADTRVRIATVERTDPATIAVDGTVSVPDFAGADVGAIGGGRGDWLFLARTAPALSTTPRNEVHIVELGSQTVLPKVTLPGEVSALASLPQGLVAASYIRADGHAGIAVLEPSSVRVEQIHTLDLLPGLRVRTLAPEPQSCDREAPSACRIFMGLESNATSPALVGAVVLDSSNPGALMMAPALRETAAQTITHIAFDPDGLDMWAVAGSRNVLSPMRVDR